MDNAPANVKNKFVLMPDKDEDVWKMYKKQIACFWTPEEIDLTQDIVDWETLNANEKHFISNVLAFFAASDGIVVENLALNFCSEVSMPEARCFYGFQIAMENIHSETYTLFIDSLIQDANEKMRLFDAVNSSPTIKQKADWALKWLDKKNNFVTRLFAFACVEGLFFSGSFCALFWLKKRNLMPGLTYSNELISRDEGLHCQFACLLAKKVACDFIDEVTAKQIMLEAFKIESEFVMDSLPCALLGINSDSMGIYIQFVVDYLMSEWGFSKIFNVENPFEWMDMISLQGKTNFFEKRVSEYQKSRLLQTREASVFRLDMSF